MQTPTFDRPLDCLATEGEAALPLMPVRPDGLETLIGSLGEAGAFLLAAGFAAKPGELAVFPASGETDAGAGGGLGGAVLGLGDAVGATSDPFLFGGLAMALPGDRAWRLRAGGYDEHAALLGFCLGAYRFDPFQTERREGGRKPARLIPPEGGEAAIEMARAIWLARDLINTPANWLGPAELAAAAGVVAERFGAAFETVTGEALARAYPAIAAVGRGSARAPVVARLRWQAPGDAAGLPLVSLCGKGVCFDSGGYDLKPSAGMLRMKKDMGGAAAMLALAAVIMHARLPVRLELRLGCVENMVSGEAMRPLDVLATRKGISVEVGNTDAEGRLVLCDLLAEACEAKPLWLIDAATLTGAARVALGPDIPALFCNDDAMAALLLAAGESEFDPLWRLPLWPGYRSWLVSRTAALNSVSSKPFAGAIVAALFLERFVDPNVAWAHIDLYAWNDADRPGRQEGGEAYAVRALLKAIASKVT